MLAITVPIVALAMAVGAQGDGIFDRVEATVSEPNLVVNLKIRSVVLSSSKWRRLRTPLTAPLRTFKYFSDDIWAPEEGNRRGLVEGGR
jgi:hypothetical protein